MQGKLPRTFRVASELAKNSVFQGTIPASGLERLNSLVGESETGIAISFEFGHNALGHALIRGNIKAELQAQCQRCLEMMTLAVDQDFELLIDATDEDVEAYGVESVDTEDGYLDLHDLVEDELILALPIVIMHDNAACNEYWQAETNEVPQPETKNSPFAALAALKDTD